MRYIITIVSLLAGLQLAAQKKADDVTGVWLTNGKDPAKIQIFRSADKYFGKIAWLKSPDENGKSKVDSKNPDESKRNQPIMGLLILQGFKFNGSDEWEDGKIYDPESGKTYSCYMSLKDNNTLKVRGYIGVSLLGRSETWTRSTL